MYPIVFYLYNRIKPAVFSLILFWAFIRFVYSNPFTPFNRDWSETEVIRSMVHNPKGCYKKTTKTLFFKHLYLICTLFYNTLSYSYVLHSTTFHTLVSDQPWLFIYWLSGNLKLGLFQFSSLVSLSISSFFLFIYSWYSGLLSSTHLRFKAWKSL